MITHIQRYSFIPVNIPIFLLFSNLISLIKKAQFSFQMLFLVQFNFSVLQSPKTIYHMWFFQSNMGLFLISQIHPKHDQNFSNLSLIHAITQIYLQNTRNKNKHANKLHANNYHPPKLSLSIVLNASRRRSKIKAGVVETNLISSR